MSEVRLIGYWIDDDRPDLPDPASFVDATWDSEERDLVGVFLGSATVFRTYMGRSTCRLCGAPNGVAERTDGSWAWPDGLAHYVLEHSVRLPQAFIEHVLARTSELDELAPSLDWWVANVT